MYEALLKKFELIIGEIFIYNNTTYLVMENSIYKKINEFEYEIDTKLMADMITGKIVRFKQWKPKYEERYYVPNIQTNALYDNFMWTGDSIDNEFLKKGLVCKTKEEATGLANKMLEVVKL